MPPLQETGKGGLQNKNNKNLQRLTSSNENTAWHKNIDHSLIDSLK